MHKGLAGGIVALALVGTGVGGYYILDTTVRSAVQIQFDAFSNSTPIITSANFESLDLNFLSDEAQFRNVRFNIDLNAMAKAYAIERDNMTLEGSAVETIKTMTVKGLRDLVLGGTWVKQIDFEAINVTADMTQTVTQSSAPPAPDLTNPDPTPTSITISTVVSGNLPHAEIYGLDVNALNMATGARAMPYKLDRYEAKDLQMILAVKQTSQGIKDSTTGELKTVPPLHSDISIARIVGTDFSADHIGSVRYENTMINLSDPEKLKDPMMMKIADLSVTDTQFANKVPLRSTLEINGFVFDTSNMTNPKGKAILSMLGIDEINLNMKTGFEFNPEQKTFTVNAFRFGLKQAGSLDLNFALSGFPEMDVLDQLGDLKKAQEQTPEEVQAEVRAAFKDTSIGQIALVYQDEGVLKKFLGAQALQLSADPTQLAEAYAQQAAMVINATHGAETAQKAQKTLTTFFTNPDALRIELKATPPINIQDLAEQIKVSGPMALHAFELVVEGGAQAIQH